jgi:ferredoxin
MHIEMAYIVRIIRPNCISDALCETVCPEIFELSNEDNLSQIVEEYRDGDNLDQGMKPDDLEDYALRAMNVCPVAIITVEEKY